MVSRTTEESVVERIPFHTTWLGKVTIHRRLSRRLRRELSRSERTEFCDQVDNKLSSWARSEFYVCVFCIKVCCLFFFCFACPVLFIFGFFTDRLYYIWFLSFYMVWLAQCALWRQTWRIRREIQNEICQDFIAKVYNRQQQELAQRQPQPTTIVRILKFKAFMDCIDVTTCRIHVLPQRHPSHSIGNATSLLSSSFPCSEMTAVVVDINDTPTILRVKEDEEEEEDAGISLERFAATENAIELVETMTTTTAGSSIMVEY